MLWPVEVPMVLTTTLPSNTATASGAAGEVMLAVLTSLVRSMTSMDWVA